MKNENYCRHYFIKFNDAIGYVEITYDEYMRVWRYAYDNFDFIMSTELADDGQIIVIREFMAFSPFCMKIV